jgi:hypothetical protein
MLHLQAVCNVTSCTRRQTMPAYIVCKQISSEFRSEQSAKIVLFLLFSVGSGKQVTRAMLKNADGFSEHVISLS